MLNLDKTSLPSPRPAASNDTSPKPTASATTGAIEIFCGVMLLIIWLPLGLIGACYSADWVLSKLPQDKLPCWLQTQPPRLPSWHAAAHRSALANREVSNALIEAINARVELASLIRKNPLPSEADIWAANTKLYNAETALAKVAQISNEEHQSLMERLKIATLSTVESGFDPKLLPWIEENRRSLPEFMTILDRKRREAGR